MSSPKSGPALRQLGEDIRHARLRRELSAAELAARAGTSPSSLARLEKGDPGVGVGTLADVLVALGLVERLTALLDVRNDELGLALAEKQLRQRGRSYDTRLRAMKKGERKSVRDVVDPDGAAF